MRRSCRVHKSRPELGPLCGGVISSVKGGVLERVSVCGLYRKESDIFYPKA